MTREEAIENLKGCVCCYEVDKDGKPNGNVTADLTQEIIEMAIKALEQEQYYKELAESYGKTINKLTKALEQQSCEDCISRERAIKQCGFGMTSLLIADCLRRLPSVKPERKPGKWLKRTDKTKKLYGWYQCSQCGSIIGEPTNYCSECGSYNGG